MPDHRTWYSSTAEDSTLAEAVTAFRQLMAGGEYMQTLYDGATPEDEFYVADDVWARDESPERMFLAVQSKDYAVASFFHAIGPERAALMPGWCGNFLLTADQVRETLPDIERALSFTSKELAAVVDQDWLDYAPDEESVLTGPLAPVAPRHGGWTRPLRRERAHPLTRSGPGGREVGLVANHRMPVFASPCLLVVSGSSVHAGQVGGGGFAVLVQQDFELRPVRRRERVDGICP
ncbi:hypothetical protein [Streptomyces sp. NPDC000405]|uniref:hypothetical protein n=1 Tax=Streptomyces sp. NPDC000405 TaxID=3161033 RepID=UPI00398CFDA2